MLPVLGMQAAMFCTGCRIKPLLVLLPGLDGSGELFGSFTAALLPELPPLLISYPRDQVLDYRELTDYVRARLPRGQPFVVLGESFSGPVAIALAASEPDCAGLILAGSFARNPHSLLSGMQRFAALLPVWPSLTPVIAPLLLGRQRLPALRQVVAQVAPAVLRGRVHEVLTVDYSKQMTMVRVPVLYLQAAQDRVVPGSAARHLQALCPAMQVVSLPGPHLLLQTLPHQAADAVRAFCDGLNFL